MFKSVFCADGARAPRRWFKFHLHAAQIVSRFSAIAALITLAAPLFAVTFSGTNIGAIADGGSPTPTCGAPRNVNFAVSGINTAVGSVAVDFTMNPAHTWAGDLKVTLIAPDTTTQHLLFSQIGANTATDVGDNADLSGNYSFIDLASQNIWTAAASSNNAAFIIPSASYRSQAAGPAGTDSPGPAVTSISGAFASLPAGSRNGTWTLRFEDCSVQDVGTVSAAYLTLLGPTAANANVGGRVVTADGYGIRHASVTITGGNLEAPVTALTGTFGYYSFPDIEVGQTYAVTVRSKRFTFAQPSIVVTPNDEVNDLNFVAEPGDQIK